MVDENKKSGFRGAGASRSWDVPPEGTQFIPVGDWLGSLSDMGGLQSYMIDKGERWRDELGRWWDDPWNYERLPENTTVLQDIWTKGVVPAGKALSDLGQEAVQGLAARTGLKISPGQLDEQGNLPFVPNVELDPTAVKGYGEEPTPTSEPAPPTLSGAGGGSETAPSPSLTAPPQPTEFQTDIGSYQGAETQPSPETTQVPPSPMQEQGGSGPSTWDKIAQVLQSQGIQRGAEDVGRSLGRPGSDRPFAQMGHDKQTQEIKGDRLAQDKLAMEERVKMADIDSRERIAGQRYGEPITPALAAALGIPEQEQAAWVGRTVDEYNSHRMETTRASANEANNAYKMMLMYKELDTSDKMFDMAKLIMQNPYGLRMLEQLQPGLAAGIIEQARNLGIYIPQPEAAPMDAMPPETEGWISKAVQMVGDAWNRLFGGEAPKAQAPVGAGRVPPGFESLPKYAKDRVNGLMAQHGDDPVALEQELSKFLESASEEEKLLADPIRKMLSDLRRFNQSNR